MDVLPLMLGALMAMLATMLGAAAVFAVKRVPPDVLPLVIAFSAGMMALAAFEMLTESHALAGHRLALTGLVAGFVVLLVLERLLPHIHLLLGGGDVPEAGKKVALLAGTITLHNIPEGLAIASAFSASPSLGWLVTVSIALQDIPEGMIVSMPAACYGLPQRRSFMWGALSGVAEFAAAIVGFFFLSALARATPWALGFSSSAMFYVVFVELLPDVVQGGVRRRGAIAFLAGIATAYLLGAVVGR